MFAGPEAGMATFAFLDTMWSARSAGLSWEKSFYLGVVNGIAFYAGPLGPAFAGATSAAILHGNIWESTWKAQVSSIGSNLFGSLIGGGISAELNGGDFEHGMSESAYNLAAVAVISSANNYRQSRQTTGTSMLPQAKGSDEAMRSALRQTNAAERTTAGQIAGELASDKTFGWGDVYGDIKLRVTAQLNSTQPAIGQGYGISYSNINWQQIGSVVGRGAEWAVWGAGYAFDVWQGPYTPVQLYPPPPGTQPEAWYDDLTV